MPRNLLTILDLTPDEARDLVARAATMKRDRHRSAILAGKTVILIFEKASTRTRVSFEVAIRHLGGQAIFMTHNDSQLGRDEPLKDTARVLSRYADALVVRTFEHEKLEELVRYGSIPVINALSDDYHPCQILSDVQTMLEHVPNLSGVKLAYIGDGNNVAHSLINAAARFPLTVAVASPEGYDPKSAIVERAKSQGARVILTRDPAEAARDADFLYTDVWTSMGQEDEKKARQAVFSPYQINAALLGLAKPACKVLHCLPAHRGEEITDEVMESPASIVFDEAENRLHTQKAILEWIFSGNAA